MAPRGVFIFLRLFVLEFSFWAIFKDEGFFITKQKKEDKMSLFSEKDIMIVDNPEKFFGSSNNISILSDLCESTRDGFGTDVTNEDVFNHVTKCDLLAIAFQRGEAVGFSSVKLIAEEDLVFFYGTAIRKKYQGNGINRMLKEKMLALKDSKFLACTTQSPVVYKYFKRFCKKVYLSPIIPREIIQKGIRMYPKVNNQLILRDCYPECLYEKIPQIDDEKINHWFNSHLRIDKNRQSKDAVLLIGERS